MKYVFIFIIGIFLSSCTNYNKNIGKGSKDRKERDSSELIIKESPNFLKNWDLDGDGINDDILFQYSGGGHCCYKIEITLSSDKIKRKYPFKMDGGYVFGVDNSKPDHFNIKDFDHDGLPEIFMEISTYNEEKYPVRKEWTKKYGIKTNCILFDFKDYSIVVKDYKKQ